MTPQDFTEDIERVADTLKSRCAFCQSTPSRCAGHDITATSIIRALADAGRLQPQPAEVEEEFAAQFRINGRAPQLDGPHDSYEQAKEVTERWIRDTPQYKVTDVEYLRRDVIYGPWVEVGSTPEESREDHE